MRKNYFERKPELTQRLVKRVLDESGYSITELAHKINRDRSHVSRHVNGKGDASFSQIVAYLSVLPHGDAGDIVSTIVKERNHAK